jgi:hypothetical protein
MIVAIGAQNNRFIGLSTDDKTTITVNAGSTFFEANTGWMFIYNGYAWVPKSIIADGLTVNYKQISLNQATNTYDVMTATTQNLFIDAAIIHVPDDLHSVATFTGISVQTDDGTPIVLLSGTAGAKANLTGNFYSVYRGPSVTVATKKVQLTIGGATAGTGKVADITVMWRPLVAGGYYLNA